MTYECESECATHYTTAPHEVSFSASLEKENRLILNWVSVINITALNIFSKFQNRPAGEWDAFPIQGGSTTAFVINSE